jgi:hypothetical protein
MNHNDSKDLMPQPPAMILRSTLRQARLEALGGQPLDGSGFEDEHPEPDFDQSE